MSVTFAVEVDWDGNSQWTDETPRLRSVRTWAGFAAAHDPVAVPGECQVLLDNRDRRYSPANAASPLAGKLGPGRAVRVLARDGAQSWTLFRGTLTRIVPEGGPGPAW